MKDMNANKFLELAKKVTIENLSHVGETNKDLSCSELSLSRDTTAENRILFSVVITTKNYNTKISGTWYDGFDNPTNLKVDVLKVSKE